MDSVLRLLGIAHKAGRVAVGEEPVAAAARARHARVIFLAADAADNSVRRAEHLAQAGGVQTASLPFTKAELGRAVGRGVCAMLAVTEAGLAHAVARGLADARPDRYGALADALSGHAQRALDRQREQRRHEKNLRRRKAPWAPPPPGGEDLPKAAGTGRGRPGAKAAPGRGKPEAGGRSRTPGTGRSPRGGRGKRKKTP